MMKTPMSPDNMITFIDRERIRKKPKEFWTPPAPYMDEIEEEDDRVIPLD